MSAASEPDRRRPRLDQGQAATELALCVPLVCLLLLAVVQVAVLVRDQLLVQHAAREAARAASVSAEPSVAAAAAVSVIAATPSVSVSVAASAERVTATATLISTTDVPLIGALLPDIEMTSTATMAREPPP